MLGFQPYETFQALVETGGQDRTNTLLVAACDAFARRGRPTEHLGSVARTALREAKGPIMVVPLSIPDERDDWQITADEVSPQS